MSIQFFEAEKTFFLNTPHTTYSFHVDKTGHLVHYGFGTRLSGTEGLEEIFKVGGKSFAPNPAGFTGKESLNIRAQEYGTFGVGDYRPASFIIRDAGGYTATDPHYVSYQILKGKKALPGLPASFGSDSDVETLEITLEDLKTKVRFILSYSVFKDMDVIARSVRIENGGSETVTIEKASSCTVDYTSGDWDLISFPGGWAHERQFTREPVQQGIRILSSIRGFSSAQCNPFFMLAERTTTETTGRVHGFALLYSGNFAGEIERDDWGVIRTQFGLNPQMFQWKLEPNAVFQTPEVVIAASEDGFGTMTHTFHDFFRKHLIRSPWRDKQRPILINNWEATYFDFDTEKLLKIAKKASELGVEMLVLDDGWFGHRTTDNSSLGDWFVFEEKLPGGLSPIVEKVNAMGMKFGLWFEPEMISEDSKLYEAHPDWCLHIPGRPRSEGRQQLVLDMSRKEVRDELFRMMTKVLDGANIEYVKWDANRHATEVGNELLPADQQKELSHRYVLGYYELLERLLQRYPNLLIEGCSGGGGRFDAGMLYYVPQIWCSDDTDAIERLRIQYGTSFCYPCSSMGAHVSAVPNHQAHRTTPFMTRGYVALAGTFGYELDLNKLPAEEQATVSQQVALYHRINHLVAGGDYYRLTSPFCCDYTAWMNMAKDGSEFILTAVMSQYHVNMGPRILRLRGLDPEALYEDQNGIRYRGAVLMSCGITLHLTGDAETDFRYFKRVQ